MTLIANDFQAIAARLHQIKRERDGDDFVMPEGLLILLASEAAGTGIIPHCKVCLVLHEALERISVIYVDRGASVTDFVRTLMQYYGSIRMLNSREIYL